MNKDAFYAALDDPAAITPQFVDQLATTLRQFPYFHAGWMLIAKGLSVTGSVHFPTTLRQASVHVWDRGSLYWLIHNRFDKLPLPLRQRQSLPCKDDVPEPDTLEPSENALPARNQLPTVQPVASAATDDDYELELETASPAAESYNIEELGPQLCRPDERYSFSDWLEYASQLQTVTRQEAQPKKRGMDLIDKFLREDDEHIIPAATRPTALDAHKIEEESVRENDDILTETLASIYIKQKQYAKAINIFKKLSLKYPEKSGYFAARISDIENRNS